MASDAKQKASAAEVALQAVVLAVGVGSVGVLVEASQSECSPVLYGSMS